MNHQCFNHSLDMPINTIKGLFNTNGNLLSTLARDLREYDPTIVTTDFEKAGKTMFSFTRHQGRNEISLLVPMPYLSWVHLSTSYSQRDDVILKEQISKDALEGLMSLHFSIAGQIHNQMNDGDLILVSEDANCTKRNQLLKAMQNVQKALVNVGLEI